MKKKLFSFHVYGFRRNDFDHNVHMIVDAATDDDACEAAEAMSGHEYCFSSCEKLACRVSDDVKCRHLSDEELYARVPELAPQSEEE